MKVAVIGAAGSTGKELVKAALTSGHTVYAVARNPDRAVPKGISEAELERLHLVRGDVYSPDSFDAAIKHSDVVFECLGVSVNQPTSLKEDGAKAIIASMKKFGKDRLIAVTSAGAPGGQLNRSNPFARWILVPLLFNHIFADLVNAEKVIKAEQGWLRYTIFQPGHLVEAQGTRKYSVAEYAFNFDPTPFADLAHAMLDVATNGTYVHSAHLGVTAGEKIPIPSDDKTLVLLRYAFVHRVLPAIAVCVGTGLAVALARRGWRT